MEQEKTYRGKRLLIIHNGGEKQGSLYRNVCNDLGIELDHIADKPNEKAFGKIAGRLHFKFYELVLEKYYKRIIDEQKNQYDYILVIRGEYTPIRAIKYLRERFPNAKLILYMWDSIRNNKGIEKKWKLYDKVYTFDRADYLQNKEKIGFVPLYYCEEYIGSLENPKELKYDIAFIGTAHSDRPRIVNAIRRECSKYGLTMYSFLYCPHMLVFIYNKLFNRDYKGVKKKDLSFKPMTQKSIYDIYNQSNCVLDVEIETQTGLTMRTMDILGLKRKLITTNKDIKNYDFYNDDNISIIDRENVVLDLSFIKKPYREIDKRIYKNYSIESWLRQLLA